MRRLRRAICGETMSAETICRICGQPGEGQPFTDWVRDTFTNHDALYPGSIICDACAFWFDQRSERLMQLMGKDKPQKMQNYCHFVVDGQWIPVSKGDKLRMAILLLDGPFPELAAIAVSGQKHIAFRARRNQPGQSAGWVQYEEQTAWVEQDKLRSLLEVVESLYIAFSKVEIETGRYNQKRILEFGIERWYDLDQIISPVRKTVLFQLALFLAQRRDDGNKRGSNQVAQSDLETHSTRLQKPLSHDDLEPVRERDTLGSLHQQPGQVRQLNLFETQSQPGSK